MGVFGDWATKYWEAGYSPVPITPGHKGPTHLSGWQRFSNIARATEKEMEDLLERFSDYGIGLCAGPASGLVFLDIDADESEFPEFGGLVRSVIEASPVERLGRKGFAAFYRGIGRDIPSTGFDICNKDGEVRRLYDVIAAGKQLVIPPTIHPETKQPYQWLTRDNPIHLKMDDYPILTTAMLEQLQDAAADYAKSKGFDVKRGKVSLSGQFKSPDGERAPHLSQERIKTLTAAMIRNGTDPAKAFREIDLYDRTHHDRTYFSDPRKISDAKYANRYANIFHFYSRIHKTMCEDAEYGKGDFPPQPGSVGEAPLVKRPVIYEEKDEKGKVKMIPLYHSFANYLVDRFHPYKESEQQNAPCFYYNGRFYQELYHGRINKELLACAGQTLVPGHVDNFHKMAGVHIDCGAVPIAPRGLINCANGILNIKERQVSPHSRDYAFHYCLDIDFDKDAKMPVFMGFMRDILEGDEERIEQIQIFTGQTIAGGPPLDHRALILYGTGFNGKSTLLNIIRALIGARNYSAISMGRLGDRFSTIGLKNKLANIVDETPARDGIDSEMFKACVSGNVIRGEEKNRPAEEFRPTARFFFSCNEFPHFNDTSYGAERRLLIVPFRKKITVKDPYLEERIIGGEMSGILNWALEGYEKFKANNCTVPTGAAEMEVMKEYRAESNSVAAFFEDEIEVTNAEYDYITANDTYGRYSNYCTARNTREVGMTTYAKRLSEEVRGKSNLRFESIKSNGVTRHRGLRLKTNGYSRSLSH